MAKNNKWLYSVYRNSDDMLMALDVNAQEAARITGMDIKSFYHLWAIHDGCNGKWTFTRKRKKEIEEESRDGCFD